MEILKSIYYQYKDFILYGLIGGLSASFDFLVYTLLVTIWPEMNIISANAYGVVCGISLSFILNRQYNFKVKDRTLRRFLIFFAVGLIGLAISSGLIYLSVDLWDWNKLIAKLFTIGVVSIIQFLLNKTITFKETRYADAE